ncbi:MAG TPA: MBL fold metallo-hydrolase [Longimicrobiales bacterium]
MALRTMNSGIDFRAPPPTFLLAAATLACAALPGSARAQGSDDPAPVTLTYLGTAGWQLTDGEVVILVDPYISRLPTSRFRGAHWTRTGYVEDSPGSAPVLKPDTAAVDAHIRRADLILIAHSHHDHLLDAPYIARRTGARIIGTETTSRLARAAGVPDSQVITVRGGEDYSFGSVSVKVIPSLHSAAGGMGYFDGRVARKDLAPPLRVTDFVEGGTLAYLVRIGGREVLFISSANYIEREIEGLRPDAAVVAIGARQYVYDYTRRLLAALGDPPLILPNHWDGYTLPYDDPRATGSEGILRGLEAFRQEVLRYSPRTEVRTPKYFEAIRVPRRAAPEAP